MVVAQPVPTIDLTESQKAVLQKYLINGETSWEDVAHRVAEFVASAEATSELQATWREKFLSILLPMKFIPGGSILANSNHGTRGMLNCFVLSTEDHIHDITKLVSDAVLTTKFRGGVGINIGAEGSKGYIRPRGAPFRDGKALGPCAVLDMVSENSKKITTGNKARRGAFLFSMDWRHPDIWEFIQAKTQSTIDANFVKDIIEKMAQLSLSDRPNHEKQAMLNALQNELGTAWVETHLSPEGKRDRRWHNANISVQLDDHFFEKLDQGDPVANRLWDAVAQNAHDTADPGLLLIDNAKRRSPIRDFITCTNPCVTADTWIHTGEGPQQVKHLVGVQHSTYINGELFNTTAPGFFCTGVKPISKLQFAEGYRLRLTEDHLLRKVVTQTRKHQYTEWVPVKDLSPGDQVLLHDHRDLLPWSGQGSRPEGWLLGALLGDGSFFRQSDDDSMPGIMAPQGTMPPSRQTDYAVHLFDNSALSTQTATQPAAQRQIFHLETKGLTQLAQAFGITQDYKTITPEIEQGSFEFYQGFLQGLFDTDGSVHTGAEDGISVRLRHSQLSLLEAAQRMLLRVGIVAHVARCHPMANEVAPSLWAVTSPEAGSELHELVIKDENVAVFQAVVGFQDVQKADLLQAELAQHQRPLTPERFCATVATITGDGVEPVYDCTVPGPACFDANGIVAHNCGEIFLPPNSACNLGSLVLTKFVQERADGELDVDWDDLAETVAIAVRFLDNVLDVSEFATPDQKHNVTNVFRQLGLGIMGWADYLKLARVGYDSQAHLETIDHWGSWIANHAYRAAEAIAAEKGPCGVWAKIKDVKTGNPFEMWVDSEGHHYNGAEVLESGRQDLAQVPRRNATVLSIAPTGSIAQLAGCAWAFEPDFGLTVWKQVFVDASRSKQNWVQILNPYLDDLGLSEADAEIVKTTGSLAGTQYALEHPDVATSFKIAREIPPGWHILVQSKWQAWIDSSISKTINLPAQATVDDIKQIYHLAARAGLKGVTIYRSGTLDSEPIKVGDAERDT